MPLHNSINIQGLDIVETWNIASNIAQVLNGMMQAKHPEVVNMSENDTISIHVDTR